MDDIDSVQPMEVGLTRFLPKFVDRSIKRLFARKPLRNLRPAVRRAYYWYVYPLPYQLSRLRSSGARYHSGVRIAFLPERPLASSAMHKICVVSGHRILNRVTHDTDIVMYWKDATYGEDIRQRVPAFPRDRILNARCNDVSKPRLDRLHVEVFGYGANVDPFTFNGRGVKKSVLNAQHNGEVVELPITEPEPGFVYQRLIDTTQEDGRIQDIRVQIVANRIPLVYLRYRPQEDLFGALRTNISIIAETDDVLSAREQELILELTCRMGLDYGDLDVLRDRVDGRIYVVDLNHTPTGPVKGLSKEEHWIALERLANAFNDVFLPRIGRG